MGVNGGEWWGRRWGEVEAGEGVNGGEAEAGEENISPSLLLKGLQLPGNRPAVRGTFLLLELYKLGPLSSLPLFPPPLPPPSLNWLKPKDCGRREIVLCIGTGGRFFMLQCVPHVFLRFKFGGFCCRFFNYFGFSLILKGFNIGQSFSSRHIPALQILHQLRFCLFILNSSLVFFFLLYFSLSLSGPRGRSAAGLVCPPIPGFFPVGSAKFRIEIQLIIMRQGLVRLA